MGAGSDGVKAEYGPMAVLAGVLSNGTESTGSAGWTAATGNPQMDAALGDLAAWLRICVTSLATGATTTSASVRTVMGRFAEADG